MLTGGINVVSVVLIFSVPQEIMSMVLHLPLNGLDQQAKLQRWYGLDVLITMSLLKYVVLLHMTAVAPNMKQLKYGNQTKAGG